MSSNDPRRFPGEEADLETVRKIAQKWGYGNCIQHLKRLWADHLVARWKFAPEDAADAVGLGER